MLKKALIPLLFVAASSQAELVGQWDFENNTLDSSGNHILSEDRGEIPLSYIDRNGEKAAYFADNSYVALDHSYDTYQSAMSFSLWFNTSHNTAITDWGSETGNWSILDFDRSDYFNFALDGEGHAWLGIAFVTERIDYDTSPRNVYDHKSAETFNDGNWHQVVTTYGKHNGLQVRIDGDVVISDTYRGEFGRTDSVRYGIMGDGTEAETYDGERNTLYYEGAIDNVKLYDDELAMQHIDNLFLYDTVEDVPAPLFGGLSLLLLPFLRKTQNLKSF